MSYEKIKEAVIKQLNCDDVQQTFKDVVNGALLILQDGVSMRPYNLGYGSTVTIGDIVDCILKGSKLSPEVYYDESKPTTIP